MNYEVMLMDLTTKQFITSYQTTIIPMKDDLISHKIYGDDKPNPEVKIFEVKLRTLTATSSNRIVCFVSEIIDL